MKTPHPAPPTQANAVTHYENFPVASWLCPAPLRPPIAAIYAFARAADDIADEGDCTAPQRLEQLHAYRQELYATTLQHRPPQAQWAQIFGPLAYNVVQHQLPVALLDDLLTAFIRDVERTQTQRTYADRAELLDYCHYSANPVGRLLLHLYGIHDAQALSQSDAICTALQLINFWQDLSEDIPRARHYITDADCRRFGVERQDIALQLLTSNLKNLIAENLDWTRTIMQKGAPLVHRLPGRIGWELRLVVQGGLCVLDKVQALDGQNLNIRTTIGKTDLPKIAWRACTMGWKKQLS